MPNDRLDARFGRSRSTRRTAGTPSGRAVVPALEFLPNIDADRRRLPTRVEADLKPVVLDHVATTKSGADNDLVTLTVRPGTASQSPRPLTLAIRGDLANKVNLYDAKGSRLKPVRSGGQTVDYGITLAGRDLRLRLECSTLAGSPLSPLSKRRIDVDLVEGAAGGTRTVRDTLGLAIAQVRLADCLDRPELLYVCETDDNEPAVRDLRAGLPKGVPLRVVPETVSGGDTWLQDQMEFGFLEAQDRRLRVVLHLPRLRSDAAQITPDPVPNLGRFVTSHFPSRDIGIFDDLWRRKVTVILATGASHTIDFQDTGGIQSSMHTVVQLERDIFEALNRMRTKPATTKEIVKARADRKMRGWSYRLRRLSGLVDLLVKAAAEDDAAGARADDDMSGAAVKAANAAAVREAQRRLRLVVKSKASPSGTFAFDADTVTIPVGKSQTIRLKSADADELDSRIGSMLHGVNYGGNIEATPPDRAARSGRVLIGSQGDVDDDVKRILVDQELQPRVTIDTSWLSVGHVDEVIACVPDRRRSNRFAFLCASPGLAIRMVNEAAERYINGLKPDSGQLIELAEFGTAPRRPVTRPTIEGKHPVTRLLRGKLWHHVTVKGAPQGIIPPKIYRDFARIDTQFQPPGKTVRQPMASIGRYYIQHWDKERLYPADIGVHELGYLDRLPWRVLHKASMSHVGALKAGRMPRELVQGIESAGGRVDSKAKVTTSARDTDKWLVRGPWAIYRMTIQGGRLVVEEKVSVNAWLEANHIAKATKTLKETFPRSRILPLPVVFDTVGDVRGWETRVENQTGAFTPNLVNLQSVGSTLLVPRPFGPRLRPDDAIALVRDLLDDFDMGAARKILTRKWVKDRRLAGIRFWIRGEPAIYLPAAGRAAVGQQLFEGIETDRDIARMFLDGFPGKKIEEVERLIYEANGGRSGRGLFDSTSGRLKKGWQPVVIPEDTVDVFELWTELAATLLGLRVRWVDSWYYHVRSGGVHCGTKVLREPGRGLPRS